MHLICIPVAPYIKNILFFFPLWLCGLSQAMASSSTRFPDHTQRRSTVGRTPLDEWSARRRDFYLTTHNTHNRQTSMPPVVFEPTISAGERQQTHALDRAATGTGLKNILCSLIWNKTSQIFLISASVLWSWSVVLTVLYCNWCDHNSKGKGKSILLQAWSGPEGSRKLRFPDYMTPAQDVGKAVSPTHRPP